MKFDWVVYSNLCFPIVYCGIFSGLSLAGKVSNLDYYVCLGGTRLYDVKSVSKPKPKPKPKPHLIGRMKERIQHEKKNVIKPFWNDATKAWSQRSLSCAKVNCDELPSASWTPTSPKLAWNSWFKVHAQNMAYSGSSPMVSSPPQPAL